MLDKVVEDSRHKFVYYNEDDKDILVNSVSEYSPSIDTDDPIAIYMSDFSLVSLDNKLDLNQVKILSFHKRYFDILIFLSILDLLMCTIDINVLNERLGKLFRCCSRICKLDIKDIVKLRNVLIDSKSFYEMAYIEYMNTGKINNNITGIMDVVIIDALIPIINDCLGFYKYFSLLLDIDDDISIYNKVVINNYINSRCNKYLSLNVLLNGVNWDCYDCSNGSHIQYTHDYTLIDLRKENLKVRSRHK